MSKALVVLSGGQDSVTCLGVALKQHNEVEAISFVYGQRHEVEINFAGDLCVDLGVLHKRVDLRFLGEMVTSALLDKTSSVNEKHPNKQDLPASYVPNRNALFLTIAHAYAQEIGARFVYGGMCETDYSGYPDCRYLFITELQRALNTGYETNILFLTPLMFLNKAEIFKLAADVDFLRIVLEKSLTCYEGDVYTLNQWGRGCGECPACKLRAKGWEQYKQIEGGRR